MGAFICWLGVRVLAMHRILKPTGSMYLHIDHTAHAYVKAMMDAIFGVKNFRNEIVWHYRRWTGNAKRFQRLHDSILFYSKSGNYTFNQLYTEYTQGSQQRKEQGVLHRFKRGDTPHWVSDGELDERGVPENDVWQIPFVAPSAKERVGYPTQKPLALYERIVKASSKEEQIVLDPFAGCATACVAAEREGRGWIAVDINEESKDVVLSRLRAEAQLPQGKQSWNRAISVKTKPPKRTDAGEEAAPELTLVSPKPKAPRLTARELRARLIMADGVKCQGCGWVPHNEEYLEVDHRVPKSREGRDDIRNRVLLCSPCNGAKGNKMTLAELRQRRIEDDRMVDKSWNKAWYERTGRFG